MMIGLRGGPQAFDGEDLLRRMVQWFTLDQPKENNQLWMKLEVLLAEME